jgi:hypothetical protein
MHRSSRDLTTSPQREFFFNQQFDATIKTTRASSQMRATKRAKIAVSGDTLGSSSLRLPVRPHHTTERVKRLGDTGQRDEEVAPLLDGRVIDRAAGMDLGPEAHELPSHSAPHKFFRRVLRLRGEIALDKVRVDTVVCVLVGVSRHERRNGARVEEIFVSQVTHDDLTFVRKFHELIAEQADAVGVLFLVGASTPSRKRIEKKLNP